MVQKDFSTQNQHTQIMFLYNIKDHVDTKANTYYHLQCPQIKFAGRIRTKHIPFC